ncbi:hypothetical protein M885DRAFT_526978 [Pelagophyceae sp. CCMP2097]|nr:hypothetical protein M885DRAFT_526978 [Pelagophyceae sp. CCMP2097]
MVHQRPLRALHASNPRPAKRSTPPPSPQKHRTPQERAPGAPRTLADSVSRRLIRCQSRPNRP